MKGILMLLLIVAVIYFLINAYVKERRQFKPGHNPYARICRKCGAHQHQHRSNVEGFEHHTWWEEMYPIGNDPNCKCHSYADNHG